jgi:hypothetical protein
MTFYDFLTFYDRFLYFMTFYDFYDKLDALLKYINFHLKNDERLFQESSVIQCKNAQKLTPLLVRVF